MKSARLLFGLLPLLLRAQAPAPAAAPSPCSNTPAYTPCELVFELSDRDAAANPNPYTSVDLKIEFRSPRQRTHAVPAFWDGGRRMVVRFAPTESGQWDYHVTSNISAWNDQTGSFTAAASDSPGFIRAANVHHWAYTEKASTGLDQPHLWMGATELSFPTMDEAAFRAVADARAAQKFNHLRGVVLMPGSAAYQSADSPNIEFFRRLDGRVRYLNGKGIIADLVLAAGPGTLTKTFPAWEQRRRFVRYLVGRYAAMNVTWQGVDRFEDYPGGRALLKETGGLIKELDPYNHPRTSGARITSAPLLDDGWQNFVSYGSAADDAVGAIEHQLYAVPFVNMDFGREDSGAGKTLPGDVDAAAFRHRLWNATMDGEYVNYTNTGSGPQYVNSPGAKAMTAWYDLLSETRHWELEPYFDVDGGRALALEDTEYLVYVEKPGPIELSVEKHGYDVYWIDPATGETTKDKKKFSGEHFTGEPPDRAHDWLLHVVREGRVASMNKSYKFESRPIVLQEIEANSPKVPFAMEQPKGDLSLSKSTPYAAKVTKATRATRFMTWLWLGDVAADHQGYRVLATGQQGDMKPPADIATQYPAVMHLRLYGMNANGKVYELDSACGINP